MDIRFTLLNASSLTQRLAAVALFSCAATVGLQAQSASSATSFKGNSAAPVLSASLANPLSFPEATTGATDSAVPTYSSSTGAAETAAAENFISSAAGSDADLQPPPRRRYGRPRYADSSHNPDGSNKWTGLGGVGVTLPIGNTHRYFTPSYGFQVGFGRNFNKNVALLAQFDYDHFGLQGATIANQEYVYNYGCTATLIALGYCSIVSGLDGNNHVWSFTLDPTFTLSTVGSVGAYVVGGVGFYHKVTNFTLPAAACADILCEYEYEVNENVDHYFSNSVGVNAGIGFTYKVSRFANERLYAEARYVFLPNSQRQGYTASNVATTTYNGGNDFPVNSNRTTYIPIKFGIRF